MRLVSLLLLGVLTPVGAGCSMMEIDSEYPPEASFEGFETYAWRVRGEDRGRRRIAPLAARQLVSSVDRELAAKGYRKVESDPDFLVDFVTASQDRVGETVVITDERVGWVSGRSDVFVERSGALILMINEPDSERVLWRGWATGAVEPDIEKTAKKLDEAATRILALFPPKG
ncbi:MAG: DUF4136 domain-containing protein [Gemmatimonadetes bacterium]|nr:DUF4136 domain-containing protein [Gemmatimonadota bacterium]NIO33095.1 DUF4136 domain-containing protein [Gemmatimonadota bacterium]